jgi:outer membrane protein assembly factor BamA
MRHEMAWDLQREGWAHAVVYSRSYVDRKVKRVHWVYWVDTGPRTTIGSIQVEGAHKVGADKALARAGIAPGLPYSLALEDSIEQDLLDTGAYASVVVKPTNLQTERVIPGERPDTGGVMTAEQVDAQGNLVPRVLPKDANFRLVLVEAPTTELSMRAGAEADPTRADLYVGATEWNRNLFGAYQHLVLEGRIGYGLLWSGDEDETSGAYGEALVRYINAGMLGRLVDFRLSARYRDVLFPGSRLREVSAGPGFRAKLAQKLFFDLDLLYRYEQDVGYGPFDAATRDALSLPDDDTAHGPALDLALVWDARNDRVEPTRGHLLGLYGSLSPGEDLGTHRHALISPEARGFIPLSESVSLGARARFSVVVAEGDEGVPLGGRLFGGGAFGMRGFGRDQLSPEVACAAGSECDTELVGGLSLLESSLELRFLPFRKFFGAVGFVDVGGAGPAQDPLEDGVSLAVGIGPRLRIWYIPIALDAAYRVIGRGELESAGSWDPYLVFLRIGEAF